jgi:hypothetical protein
MKPATTTLIMALKAAVLPMLIRARRSAMIEVTRIEYRGRPDG